MPYYRYGRRSRFPRKTRKPLKRLAKRARYRKGASAQSRQISKIAKHLSKLKSDVKQDTSASALYKMQFQSPLKVTTAANMHCIIPLTCGVSQKNASPFEPITNLNLPQIYGGTLNWEPIFQPRDLHPTNADGNRAAVPPWIKVYKQHCKLRFWAGTVDQPVDLTVSVLRVNTNGPIANIKSIASRLDGANAAGPDPDNTNLESYIQQNRDYASNQGVVFNQPTADPAGAVPIFPQPNPTGDTNMMWNKNLWTVEYQKQFTLGAARNPLGVGPTPIPTTPLGRAPDAPSQFFPDDNQFSEECRFTINYGGMKLSSVPPPDSSNLALDPMVVTDMAYKDIPPEHKRFLVISSSQPQVGASVYAPYMAFASTISTRVPI